MLWHMVLERSKIEEAENLSQELQKGTYRHADRTHSNDERDNGSTACWQNKKYQREQRCADAGNNQ